MNILNGINNFLKFINDNWTLITTIITLGILVFIKVKKYISLTKEQKIDLALTNASNIILGLVTNAQEIYGNDTNKIKRATVIAELYEKFPELKFVVDQPSLLEKIDKMIDDALIEMKKVLAEKATKEIKVNTSDATIIGKSSLTDSPITDSNKTE